MKVLIPTLRFPPAGGVGLRRIIKVAKEYSNNGIEVHFITTENRKQVNNYEHDLSNNIIVNKIPSLSLNNYFNKEIKSTFAKVLRRFTYYLTSPCFFVDYGLLWGIVLIPYMLKYIKENRIVNVYCSGAPFSTLWQVAIVKRLLGKRINLICEWRDPWVDDFDRNFFPPPKRLNKRLQRMMENFVIRQCDKGIVVTKGMMQFIPLEYRQKFSVIENGFDEDELTEEMFYKYKNYKTKNIVYTGNIVDEGRFEGLRLFLKAFRECINIDCGLRFQLCGQLSYKVEKYIKKEYSDLLRAGSIDILGIVSTRDAIEIMAKSGFGLVLVQRSQPEALTSKFFEYCACGKKIIAIGPDGDLKSKMNEQGIRGYFELDSFIELRRIKDYILDAQNDDIDENGYLKLREDNSFSSIAKRVVDLFK